MALAPTALTAISPAGAVAGSSVTVAGALSSGGAAVSLTTVSVTRTGCSTGWSASVRTAADGSWSFVDEGVPGGTCTYSAAYAGSSTYASASGSTSTSVSLRPADLALSVVRGTGSAKKYAYVTAKLGGWHSNRTVTITAQPSGGVETVLASGAVDRTGTLTATYSPKTTTTYRVRYTGDDWYAPGLAERAQ